MPCANADDMSVAASSFRRLMTALTPAIQVVDQIAGLNLNHHKCCWAQYGSESCQCLLDWVATNCEEFGEMKIVKVCQLPWHHDWTGRPYSPLDSTTKKFHSTCQEEKASTKSLVERLCDLKIYALSVLGKIGSMSAPDEATLKAEARALQCTTAGPDNAIPTDLQCVGSTLWPWTRLAWDSLPQPRGPL